MLSFIPSTVSKGSSSVAEWEYADSATSRRFEVRELRGPTAIEVVAGKVPSSSSASRFFLSEYVPNDRLVKEGKDGAEDSYMEIPSPAWKKAKRIPSAAWALIGKIANANPGFSPIMWGSGLGSRSHFYPSLDECSKQIQNALDGDYWYASEEPVKSIVLADRCTITLEGKALLDRMPGEDQISASIADVASRLSPLEICEVSEHLGTIRVEVREPAREYPDSCRLMLLLSSDGRVRGNTGFVRAGWSELGDRLARRTLPRFDGPEGLSSGFPAYGQSFVAPGVQPAGVQRVEVLHKIEGTSNKVYAYARLNGRSVFVWGRFSSGRFQSMAADGSGYGKLSEKRAKGYEPIPPEFVPEFWTRLQAAIDGR